MDVRIRQLLEKAYRDFHSQGRRERDPIALVYNYPDPQDQEVAALVTALLAYGNVTSILKSASRVLDALGPNPHQSFIDDSLSERLRRLGKFRHRFTTEDDLKILFTWLSLALKESGSIEAYFMAGQNKALVTTRELLSSFVSRLFDEPLPPSLKEVFITRERNLKYLVSNPTRGSACKRLNMFLRWVVRPKDGIDLGLWSALNPAHLILPVDTHLLSTLRALNWTVAKQANWKVAEDATNRLRKYSPADPVRYDFALCHLSMSGNDIRDYL